MLFHVLGLLVPPLFRHSMTVLPFPGRCRPENLESMVPRYGSLYLFLAFSQASRDRSSNGAGLAGFTPAP